VLKLSDINSGEISEHDSRKADKRTLHLFGPDKTTREFYHGWEFLMGQGEVQNYLRSTQGKTVHMRYGGEYKFAGGRLEDGETPLEAARRELEEEFMLTLPVSAILRLFHIRQTRPVQNTSFIMYSFLCLESENPWLNDPKLSDLINTQLENRRVEFQSIMESGLFEQLTKAEKEKVCPEVNRVDWLDMRDAVAHSYTSMNSTLTCVNEWQRNEFERLGKSSRDPLFVTMAVMTDLDKHANNLEAIEAARQFDGAMAEREAVWLRDGMSGEELRSALAARGSDATQDQPALAGAAKLSDAEDTASTAKSGKL
jgi:8-oxo-dGTP pyrophosphatase MutT (NUDIX family)